MWIEKAARAVKYKHRKFGGYDSKGKKRWIYYYDDPSKNKGAAKSELHAIKGRMSVGDSFSYEGGRIEITGIEGNRSKYKDADGNAHSMNTELLQMRLTDEHKASIEAAIVDGYKKRKAVSDAANKHGSEKQKARAKALLDGWLDSYGMSESEMQEGIREIEGGGDAVAKEASAPAPAPKVEESAPKAKKEKKPKKQVVPKAETAPVDPKAETSAEEDSPMTVENLNKMLQESASNPSVNNVIVAQKLAAHYGEKGAPPSRETFLSWVKTATKKQIKYADAETLRSLIPKGKKSSVQKSAGFLKQQISMISKGEIDAPAPMPPDLGSMSPIKTLEQLFETGRPRAIGTGAFGEVYGDKGPPPKAYKYGTVSAADFEIGAIAGELGIGAKIYAGQVGKASKDTAAQGKVEMEFLENHQTAWDYLVKAKAMDASGRFLDTPEAMKAKEEVFKKQILQMQTLHLAGYSHNDTHLGNLLLSSKGEPKLIDYGLAKKGYQSAYLEIAGVEFSQKLSAFADQETRRAARILRDEAEKEVSARIGRGEDPETVYPQVVLTFHTELNKVIGGPSLE